MATETTAICFRIYTEDVPPGDPRLAAMGITPEVIVSLAFPSFTIYRVHGAWKDTYEDSLVFEIIGTPAMEVSVLRVAKEIQKRCDQGDVIVTTHPIKITHLIGD